MLLNIAKTALNINGTLDTMLLNIKEKPLNVSFYFGLFIICIISILVCSEIMAAVPGSQVIINLVPKEFAMHDIYCQLIPNDDAN
mgnify:CR=1 FL=1